MKVKIAAGAKADVPGRVEVEGDRAEVGKVGNEGCGSGAEQGRSFHGLKGDGPGGGLGEKDGSYTARAE